MDGWFSAPFKRRWQILLKMLPLASSWEHGRNGTRESMKGKGLLGIFQCFKTWLSCFILNSAGWVLWICRFPSFEASSSFKTWKIETIFLFSFLKDYSEFLWQKGSRVLTQYGLTQPEHGELGAESEFSNTSLFFLICFFENLFILVFIAVFKPRKIVWNINIWFLQKLVNIVDGPAFRLGGDSFCMPPSGWGVLVVYKQNTQMKSRKVSCWWFFVFFFNSTKKVSAVRGDHTSCAILYWSCWRRGFE